MSIVSRTADPRPPQHRARTPTAVPTASGSRGAAGFARSVAAWLLLLTAVAVLAAAVLVPRIGGATPYTVLTGSMIPTYPPGTMIVARPVATEDVDLGTVITFQITSGDPTVATHRVVAVAHNAADGQVRFQTQGDANPSPDLKWVRPEQIRGQLWYAVPYLGRLSQLLTGEQRQWGVLIVAIGLLLYTGVMFTGVAREKLRDRKST